MPINTKELLDGLSILMDEENMKVTIKETGKGTLVCATACFIGGLIGGPIGLAVGGTVGGISAAQITKGILGGPIGLAVGGTLGGLGAALMTKDKFKPVSHVIKYDLSTEQREALAQAIMSAIQEFHAADVAAILGLLAHDRSLQERVFKTVSGYLTNEMQLKILD